MPLIRLFKRLQHSIRQQDSLPNPHLQPNSLQMLSSEAPQTHWVQVLLSYDKKRADKRE